MKYSSFSCPAGGDAAILGRKRGGFSGAGGYLIQRLKIPLLFFIR
jgi:hypothetical protein